MTPRWHPQQETTETSARSTTGTFAYAPAPALAFATPPTRARKVPLVLAFAIDPTVANAAVDLDPQLVHESFVPAWLPSE